MADNKMVVYTRDGCTRCKHTIRLATALGLEPVVINTTNVPDAGDWLVDEGYQELPVVIVYAPDGTRLADWSGNRPSKIKEWA